MLNNFFCCVLLVFFPLHIILCIKSIVILFIFYCLLILFYPINREFSNERGRVERRANFHKTRSKQQFADMFGAYLEWITHSGI